MNAFFLKGSLANNPRAKLDLSPIKMDSPTHNF